MTLAARRQSVFRRDSLRPRALELDEIAADPNEA